MKFLFVRVVALVAVWVFHVQAFGYETDQLRGRDKVVPDVQEQVDQYVNEAFERARGRAQSKLVAILKDSKIERPVSKSQAEELLRDEIIEEFPFLKLYFGTPLEKWMTEELAPRGFAIEPGGLGTGLQVNIYDRASATYFMNPFVDLPTPAMVLSFANAVAGTSLAPTFMTNGVRYGADKWSHFFRLGYRYWKRSKEGQFPERGIRYGTGTEKGGVGYRTSGALSFADLAANYDGYQMFRDLFHEEKGYFDVDPFRFWVRKGGRKKMEVRYGWAYRWTRAFLSREHVSDDWDEVLNPNVYRPHFHRAIRMHLQENRAAVCSEYRVWRDEAMVRSQNLRPLGEYADLSQVPEVIENPFGLAELCKGLN